MKRKAILFTVVAFAFGVFSSLVAGCGGGKVGGSAPGVSGKGRVAAKVSLEGTKVRARRLAGRKANQTGDKIVVAISIEGVYSVNGEAFEPVTASVEIDLETGRGAARLEQVPIGKNHVLTAVAMFPGGEKETVLGIIEEVKQDAVTQAEADSRTTPAALAMLASGKSPHEAPHEQFEAYLSYVDLLYAAGIAYSDITAGQLTDFAAKQSVPASIAVSPATATAEPDQTVQFSAAVIDGNGLETSAAVSWSLTGGVGTIDSKGLFTASSAGSGTVVATSGSVSGSAAVTVTVPAVCGNGALETGEACDDGNAADADGCSSACETEEPPYLAGRYVRGDFCAPPLATSGADFFTTKRAIESDGFGEATLTLLEHSQGFATGPRTIPFMNAAGSYYEAGSAGRYTAYSADGNVMVRTMTGIALETGEQVSAKCLSVGIRANGDSLAPPTASSLSGAYVVFSIGASGAGSPWTARERVVLDGSGNYATTFLSASFETGPGVSGTYAVSADGSVALTQSGSAGTVASGMMTPDGGLFYVVKTDPSAGGAGVYLSVGMKESASYAGPPSGDRYGLYMLGVESMEGLWVNVEYGTLDIGSGQSAAYNTVVNSNNSMASSSITFTYDSTGQIVTNEGAYGMVSPGGGLLMLADTDPSGDYYVNMTFGARREAAP